MSGEPVVLAFASDFSPSQLDLSRVLELADANGGDTKRFEAAVQAEYYDALAISGKNKRTRAYNVKLTMATYGIVDADANLTPFGRELFALRDDPATLYAALARHILLHLRGIALIQCVQDLQAAGDPLDLVTLRAELERRGIGVPSGSSRISIMRLWLERAGVFVSGWRVNEARLEELTGTAVAEIAALAVFTANQRAYVKTLANMGGAGPYASNSVAALAATTYGVRFNEKTLAKDLLRPLERAGYITMEKTTAGRGARPFDVAPTAKLAADIIEPLLRQIEEQVGAEMRPLLRKPLAEILSELRPPSTITRAGWRWKGRRSS